MVSKASVLIVEDNLILSMVTQKMISELEFECIGNVQTAADSLEMVRKYQPDIVLMDVKLKDGDGIRAATRISEVSESSILFVSGSDSHFHYDQLPDSLPFHFLSKPYLKEDLEKKLDEILQEQISNK